jgi:TRAP transporter TAXI family solute receptor
MICQGIRRALPRHKHNLRVPRLISIHPLLIGTALIGIVMTSMFARGALAIEQMSGPKSAHAPRLEEQWKAKVNANTVSIIAGSPEETYLDITHDLAVVLNDDNLRILPIVGMGGAQNIRDVLYLKGVDVGITSTQMLRYFASTGELSSALDERLTYITRMFPEEMHVVAGRGVKTIEELNGKKVNFSDSGSSTQITARDVFGLLGIAVEEVNLSQADAITAIKNGEIAATVVFSGKPAGIFSRISANDNLHLLEIPFSRTLENIYSPAQLEQALYPNLVDKGQAIQTVAVDAVLITNNWQPASDRYRRVAKFVEALFSRFAEFKKPPRHPKWQEVDLTKELPGWQRFPAAQELLQQAKFDEFRAKFHGGSVSAQSPTEKQQLFREFRDWSEGERKRQ